MDDSTLRYPWNLHSGWMSNLESKYWQGLLLEHLNWQRHVVTVYGRKFFIPRQTCFLAEEGITYKYSGIEHIGLGWPSWFTPLLIKVREACDVKFNGCLLNLYRNGFDRMGWHSDNERELDKSKSIASLSLGTTRDFCFRSHNKLSRETLALGNGDLLIMDPKCQFEWVHSLPARRRILSMRINLTFRSYI